MAFEDFWKRLQHKNDGLQGSDTMRISVVAFKKAMILAFDAGKRDGIAEAKARQDFERVGNPFGEYQDILGDLFNFGKKK